MENNDKTSNKRIDIRTKKQKKRDEDKEIMERMIQQLEIEKGVVYWALKKVGISYTRHTKLMDEYPSYKKQVEEVLQETNVWIFSKLAELIEDKNPQAVIFACKSRLHMAEPTETTVKMEATDLVDVGGVLEEIKKRVSEGL